MEQCVRAAARGREHLVALGLLQGAQHVAGRVRQRANAAAGLAVAKGGRPTREINFRSSQSDSFVGPPTRYREKADSSHGGRPKPLGVALAQGSAQRSVFILG